VRARTRVMPQKMRAIRAYDTLSARFELSAAPANLMPARSVSGDMLPKMLSAFMFTACLNPPVLTLMPTARTMPRETL